MDGMYGFHPTCDYSDKPVMMMSQDNLMFPSDYQTLLCSSAGDNRVSDVFGSNELLSVAASAMSSEAASMGPEIRTNNGNVSLGVVKAKIACHPSYPRLLQAYMDCQKVGAPPEIAYLLEEIQRESHVYKQGVAPSSSCFGADPELDEFMETYCEILVKYKSDLARPFDEATTFLNKIEMQLRNLCTGVESARGLSEILILTFQSLVAY
ncbi:BnaA08g20500D [Brassica napus]|uniref:BnaA08g20500D protein n=1 Tax=Brassica napus TaxID=3708 RepID=A0A078HXG8_BRANA|nr:BnaA08g20500D [Brassica napus]